MKQRFVTFLHSSFPHEGNLCKKNVDSLEDLLHDLDYAFDVIALTETWNPEKSKDTFRAKQIPGYLDYFGVEGSSMKGGCGFYIKDSFTPIPRKDLEFKITDTGAETENCWIELVNNSGPNVLVGAFYRHPSRIIINTHSYPEILHNMKN